MFDVTGSWFHRRVFMDVDDKDANLNEDNVVHEILHFKLVLKLLAFIKRITASMLISALNSSFRHPQYNSRTPVDFWISSISHATEEQRCIQRPWTNLVAPRLESVAKSYFLGPVPIAGDSW